MASDTDGYIDRIVEAAHKLDLEAVRLGWQSLYQHLDATGAPLDDRQGFRLVEALETSGVFDNFAGDKQQPIVEMIAKAEAAAKAKDAQQFALRLEDVKKEMRNLDRPLKTALCNQLLKAMRDERAYDGIIWVTEKLTSIGQDHATLKRYYAQALIEKDQISAAIAVLEKLAASKSIPDQERAEAIGLLGRANKQIYIDGQRAGQARPATRDALRSAIRYYSMGVDPKDLAKTCWHAINLIAMIERAKADGVDIATTFDGRALASKLIAELTPRAQRSNDPWEAATIAESYVALGDWQQAAYWYGQYADNKDVTGFQLNGTIRQLDQVWKLKDGEGQGGQLLTLLKARLLAKPNVRVELNADEQSRIMQSHDADPVMYQKIMHSQGPARLKWFKLGILRAQAVARICDGRGLAIGTGFLVDPKSFSARLHKIYKDEWLLLTNSHVLNTRGENGALQPAHARIYLDSLETRRARDLQGYNCGNILWESPSTELDATLVRLDPPIGASEVEALPLASPGKQTQIRPRSLLKTTTGAHDGASRVFVIGHPFGQELCIALDDSDVLDRGVRDPAKGIEYLHYRTPTEKGNSGSPVLDDTDWEVVALHHAGGHMAMLSKPEIFHDANEGVAITSIIQAVDAHFRSPFRLR